MYFLETDLFTLFIILIFSLLVELESSSTLTSFQYPLVPSLAFALPSITLFFNLPTKVIFTLSGELDIISNFIPSLLAAKPLILKLFLKLSFSTTNEL